MTNWSIGVDIIDIERFQRYTIEEHRNFYEKVFNAQEISYCLSYKDSHPHFAGLFAAKEAVFKAINKFVKIELYHIFISHNKTKKPRVEIAFKEKNTKKGDEIQQQLKNLTISVSISHTEKTAIAWALVVKKDQEKKLHKKWNEIEKSVQEVIQHELTTKNTD